MRDSAGFIGAIAPNPSQAVARLDVTQTDTDFVSVQSDIGKGAFGQYILDAAIWPTGAVSFADLSVSQVVTPASAPSGGEAHVSWTVGNFGTAATEVNSWNDRLVLSLNDKFGDTDDIVLLTKQHTGSLTPGSSYAEQADVTLPVLISGPYWLFVKTDAAQQVFEFLFEENNIARGAAQVGIIPTPTADLQIETISAPAQGVAGQPVSVSWTVRNAGAATTGDGRPGGLVSQWTDRVFLSSDNVLNGADAEIGRVTHQGALGAGETYLAQGTFNLPASIQGDFFLIVATDAFNDVVEGSAEANNQKVAPVPLNIVDKVPDLVVAPLTVPASVQADQTIQLNWTVTNTGQAAATGTWVDRIYLSPDGTIPQATLLDSVTYSASLAVGAHYVQSRTITLPRIADGSYRFIVVTDVNNTVAERTGEGNNSSVAATPTALGHADLTVSALSVPANPTPANPIQLTVSWTTTNVGNRATLTDKWTEEILLTTNGIIGDGDDVILGSFQHVGILAAGESTMPESVIVSVPILSGQFFVAVRVDSGNTVFEGLTEASNVSDLSPLMLNTTYADLVVESVSVPATANTGEPFQLVWRVRNVGIDKTNAASWTDHVLLSSDAVLDASDFILGTVTHSGLLLTDGTYTGTLSPTLPETLSAGQYFVFVTSDSANAVFEDGFESNNSGRSDAALQISLRPVPDLQVASVTSQSAVAQPGQTVNVSWSVVNNGQVPAHGSWTDRLYLAPNGTLTGAIQLASMTRSDAVAIGDSYSASASVIVPNVADGNYTFVVVTDADNTLFERAGDSNNGTAQAGTMQILHPDLQVVTPIAAVTAANSGASIAVDWAVKNFATGVASASWIDSIYLSDDASLSGNDRLLGTVTHATTLAAGEQYTAHSDVIIPVDASGAKFILVRTDSGGQVNEAADEGNNVSAKSITINLSPYADLAVSNVSVLPERAIGDPALVSVSWTVSNTGTGPGLTSSWVDEVFIVETGQIVGQFIHNGSLAVGGSYSETKDVFLPPSFSNRIHFGVRADAQNTVFENGLEQNNSSSTPTSTDIMRVPYADLIVMAIQPLNAAASGKTLAFSWTVNNQGIGPTDIGSWSDSVKLVRHADGSGVIKDYGSFSHIGVLSAGASYSRTESLLLPEGLDGSVYLLVEPRGPYEFLFGDNNKLVSNPIAVTLSPSPDLRVTDITLPATQERVEGGTFDVTWTVTNTGEATANGSWVDQLVLRPVGNATGATINLGSFTRDIALDPGTSYTRTEQFRLPERIQGTYEVVVTTNVNKSLFEAATAAQNNQTNDDQPVTISLRARPNLQVSTITVPGTLAAGSGITVQYEVFNQGSAGTPGLHWKDNVYLSLDSRITSDDILLTSADNPQALGINESYLSSAIQGVIPLRFGGEAFIIVQADAGNVVDEFPQDEANIMAQQIFIVPKPFADLVTSTAWRK